MGEVWWLDVQSWDQCNNQDWCRRSRTKRDVFRPCGILRTCYHSFIVQNFPLKSIWSQLYLLFIFDDELMLQLTACDRSVGSENPKLISLDLIISLRTSNRKKLLPAHWEPPGVPDDQSVVLVGGSTVGIWEYIQILLSHNLKHLCKKINLTSACDEISQLWCIKSPTLRVCY